MIIFCRWLLGVVDSLHIFLSGIVYGEPAEVEEIPVECEECSVKDIFITLKMLYIGIH